MKGNQGTLLMIEIIMHSQCNIIVSPSIHLPKRLMDRPGNTLQTVYTDRARGGDSAHVLGDVGPSCHLLRGQHGLIGTYLSKFIMRQQAVWEQRAQVAYKNMASKLKDQVTWLWLEVVSRDRFSGQKRAQCRELCYSSLNQSKIWAGSWIKLKVSYKLH